MLVLLVEDHADTREATVLFLQAKGLSVETADSGPEAIARAGRRSPDVIVMDLGLPGMDGWQATRALKSSAATRHVPILVLSGHALPKDEERAREMGCDVFLRKPCRPADLLSAIRRVVSASSPPPEAGA